MKICMLTRTYPPRIGGPGSIVHRLSKALTDEGFDITVITQKIGSAPKFEIDNGVKVYRTYCLSDVNEFTIPNLSVGILAFTKKILENKDNDVFHAHDISVAGFSGCVAKKFIGKSFLLKYGGDLVFEYLSLKRPKGWHSKRGLEGTLEYKHGTAYVLHMIQDWYFKNYDLILPDARYGKEFLIKRGVPEKKIWVLPNGVDINLFQPEDREKLKKKLGFKGKMIFTAGRLVEWKGFDVLIKAMKRVLEETDATLVIGGIGPQMEELKRLTGRLGLEKRIQFVGSISRNDMPDYIGMCDVFAIPSYFDTSPNVLLEAMACGKPCVVSDIDGVREVVEGGCAMKARVGEEEDLAEKITTLLTNEKMRNQISKKARKKIEREYSWKVTLKNYVTLYETIEGSKDERFIGISS
ncbi:MAG: glycosyltransferase family 4 protein [Methanocellales archaeon]|nr:glycosyltransferase family 4 protein [Methanocellales archaeon]